MNESICVVKTPERCEDCGFYTVFMGKHYCPPKGTVVIKGERDCGCPLVAVPEAMDPNRARGAYDMAYTNGWNAFREKLIGN